MKSIFLPRFELPQRYCISLSGNTFLKTESVQKLDTSSTTSATSSTPATTSSTSSAGSTGDPRKAVPYVSRTGKRRSPRLRERRERQAAQDADLIKRYGLKRLSVVVERLPTKQVKLPQVKAEPVEYDPIPGPSKPRPVSPGPEVALPILDGVIDQVLQQVAGDIQEVFPGPPIDWSFDPESPSFIPILSPAKIPSPNIREIERSNGVIEVFDLGESPIDQARLLEANPIVPQTPDPQSKGPVMEVHAPPPAVIQAADSTLSRQIPLIVLDDDDQEPQVIEIIELE